MTLKFMTTRLRSKIRQKTLYTFAIGYKHKDVLRSLDTLRFTGSNSWHTYALLFITAYVTYKCTLPIHCMLALLWSNACMDLLYDTMNNNTDSIYNVACILMITVHTADCIEQCFDVENIFISYQL